MSQDQIRLLLNNGCVCKDWYFNKLETPSSLINNLLFWKESSHRIDEISPTKVIGHNHGSLKDTNYNWILLLSCLPRHIHDKNPQSVLAMLNEQDKLAKDDLIHLQQYGDYFFFSEGRHRIVQAKLLEVKTVHCLVTQYIFDQVSYDLYNRIKAITTIVDDFRWRLGLPVKAEFNGIEFEIPLVEGPVETLEKAMKIAHQMIKQRFNRLLVPLKYRNTEDICANYDLNKIRNPNVLVPAIINVLLK